MGAKKVESETLDAMFEAFKSALSDPDLNLGWISKSALLVRAYGFGFYNGLAPLGDEAFRRNVFWWILQGSLHGRERDDTFSGTVLGKAYGRLKSGLEQPSVAGGRDTGIDSETVADMTRQLERLDEQWQATVAHSRSILSEVFRHLDSAGKAHAHEERVALLSMAQELIRRLEDPSRLLSLIETNHELSKRLG